MAYNHDLSDITDYLKPLPPENIPVPDLNSDAVLAEMYRDLRDMALILSDMKKIDLSLWEKIWAVSKQIGESFLSEFGITRQSVLVFLIREVAKRL